MNNIGDPEGLAAEYVLGTLDAEEREQARSLLSTDETFAAKVKLWERRLGELHLMVEPVEPDPKLWQRIQARLPQVEQDVQIKPAEPPEPAPVPGAEPEAPSPEIASAAGTEAPPPAAAGAGLEEPTVPPSEAPVAQATVAPALVPMAPPAAEAATPAPPQAPALPADREDAIRRQLARWRALALLMTLLVIALAGLVAAWRVVPGRVPAALQPAELMRLLGVSLPSPQPLPRPAPPPDSQFDE